MGKIYVLGAGLAGLITAWELKLPIIGEQVGGQFAGKLPAGPRYFHKCHTLEALLRQLRIPYAEKQRLVGYYDWRTTQWKKPTKLFTWLYYKQTRHAENPPASAMNDGTASFTTLEFDVEKFMTRLSNKVDRIPENASSIGLERNLVRFDHPMYDDVEFDRLISTVPMQVFHKLIDSTTSKKTKTLSKLFVYLEYNKLKRCRGKFDMIYIINGGPSRITNVGSMQIVEYTGEYEDLKAMADSFQSQPHQLLKDIEIVDDIDLDTKFDIYFVGRYAQWKHNIRINDNLFKRIYEVADRMNLPYKDKFKTKLKERNPNKRNIFEAIKDSSFAGHGNVRY